MSPQACVEKPCSLAWHYWERWDLMGGLQIIRALSNRRLWGPSLSFAPGCEVRSFTASLFPTMIGLASSNEAEIMDPILITFPSQANYLTSGSSEGSWLTRPVGDMTVRWLSRSRGWWVTSSWDSRLTSCVFSKIFFWNLLVPLVATLKSIAFCIFTWTFKVFLRTTTTKKKSANLYW